MRNPSSKLWRTKVDLGLSTTDAAINHPLDAPLTKTVSHEATYYISQNAKGQRIDVPNSFNVHPALLNELRNRNPRLCNYHHLLRDCNDRFCPYDHNSTLTAREFEALTYLSRSQRCPQGSACVERCIKGHMCPSGRNCRHGTACRHADLHDIDTAVATKIMVS